MGVFDFLNFLRYRLWPMAIWDPRKSEIKRFWYLRQIHFWLAETDFPGARFEVKDIATRDLGVFHELISTQSKYCHEKTGWWPLSYSISEDKVVSHAPPLDERRVFSRAIPYQEYVFLSEMDYNKHYQTSVFAFTGLKSNWDSFRNVEICANTCIPVYLDLTGMPKNSMIHYPRQEMEEIANEMRRGIFLPSLRTQRFFRQYTKRYLTTAAMARYILSSAEVSEGSKLLYVDWALTQCEDYTSVATLHGLYSQGDVVIDSLFELPGWLFSDFPERERLSLHGRGFNYTGLFAEQACVEHHFSSSNEYLITASSRMPPLVHAYDFIVVGNLWRNRNLLPGLSSENLRVIGIWGEDYPPSFRFRSNVRKWFPDGHFFSVAF